MSKDQNSLHEFYMSHALAQAKKGSECGEVPVGALLVYNNQIISCQPNRREQTKDPTGHCEILTLREASEKLGRWRLTDCDLYVTLEPCVMCSGAIASSRIRHLYFGARDPKGGAVYSQFSVLNHPATHHKIGITEGLLAEESSKLLKDFFLKKRTSSLNKRKKD